MQTDSLYVPSSEFYIDSTPIQTYVLDLINSVLKSNTTLTAQKTVTHTAPASEDLALQDLVSGGYGFATKNEGNSLLAAFVNAQLRITELEQKLQDLGVLE
jgi:hypothetical protein